MVKQKVIAIIGTTASGKTGLAVRLAYKYAGEVISADSRQVYRGMDIGTGKDLDEYKIGKKEIGNWKLEIGNYDGVVDIPYHLIDVVDPMDDFGLADFQGLAFAAIDNIGGREKLPVVAGGTGMYVQALVDGYDLSDVGPDRDQREELERKSVEELFGILHDINAKFADNLNNSDKNNPRRLVRYIEMAKIYNTDLKIDAKNEKIKEKYDFLLVGLTWPREVLHSRIYKRLIERLEKEDMVGEVEGLHNDGVTWERLESFGLEYRYIARFLQEKMEYDEMVTELHRAIKKFAKRQMSWYRRWEKQGAKIHWFEGDCDEVDELVDGFLG